MAAPTQPDQGRITPRDLLWFAGIITGLAIVGSVVLVSLGHSADIIWQMFLLAAVPIITGVVTMATSALKEGQQEVKANLNGRFSQILDTVTSLTEKVTELALRVPVPPPKDEEDTQP